MGWIIKKARELQKNIYFHFIYYAKAFDFPKESCGKFLKKWEYQATWPVSWEICMQAKKQQLELDMEQNGSKLGKEYLKAMYCHSAIQLIWRIHYEKYWVGWSTSWNQDFWEKYQ